MFIAIAGNIGAGKSTLTGILAERYALTPVYEAVEENPYLEDFYRDMRRYAFHSQMFFLAKRLEQHLNTVNPGNRVIQDRTVYEDAGIFARNLFDEGIMDARDYGSYCRMFEAVKRALRPPDLLVYLRASLPTLRDRIRQRGRDYEEQISDPYLERLNRLYDRWFDAYDLSDKELIDADTLDFVNHPADLERVLRRLEPYGLSVPILP
jgi:deoxyadenosine/deoxycytidine kinase